MFNRKRVKQIVNSVILAVIVLAAGCSDVGTVSRVDVADEPIKDVEASNVDLSAMAREMATAIIELPVIKNTEGSVNLAFTTIRNRTMTVDFDSATIQSMIRKDLIAHSQGKLLFLDREASDLIYAERDAKRAGTLTSKERKDLPGADYFLIGSAFSSRKSDGRQMSAYHRYVFRLNDAETGVILWEDDYEFKKVGQPGRLYQGR